MVVGVRTVAVGVSVGERVFVGVSDFVGVLVLVGLDPSVFVSVNVFDGVRVIDGKWSSYPTAFAPSSGRQLLEDSLPVYP